MFFSKKIIAFVGVVLFCFSSEAKAVPPSFADLVDVLNPAVVNISTTQKVSGEDGPAEEFFAYQFPEGSPFSELPDLLKKFYGQEGQNSGNGGEGEGGNGEGKDHEAVSLGSGFIVDSTGYIVTNNHVIDKADEITVIFSDESKAKAKIIGRDGKTDLALLKVEVNKRLPHIEWGDSDKARVGDWVIAIGNPFGLGGSVSAGIISARARDINSGPFDDFLQTDAAINRGNSGGPLFDIDGKVIGINTAIFSPSGGNVGIGFSLPANMAKPVIDQLRAEGKVERGWLGVKIQTVTDDIAESVGLDKASGALVLDVTKGSPAAKAGIQTSDIILDFDGKEVPNMRKLPRLVADTKIGKTVPVNLWRNGKKKTLEVTIAVLDESKEEKKAKLLAEPGTGAPDSFGKTIDKFGMTLAELTPANRKLLHIKENVNGVLVVKVAKNAESATKGLMRGDVVESVNQEPVKTTEQFTKVIDNAIKAKRKSVMILVNRKGNTQFVVLNL